MSSIKILVDGHVISGYGQGIKTYIIGLYNELSYRPNVRIIMAVEDIDLARSIFAKNIELVPLKKRNKWVRLLWELPKISYQYKPDYVHFQYVLSPLVKGKKIVTVHDILCISFWRDFPLRLVLIRSVSFFLSARLADTLITDSEYSKGEIARWFRIDRADIYNIPLGVNFNKSEVTNGLENQRRNVPYILYVSRIERRKNHHLLIEAYFRSEIHKEMNLVFVGKEALKYPQLEKSMETLNNADRSKISFMSDVSNEDLISLYSNAELFVFPSLSEGFGIPPLEAASFAIPVICSNSTSLSEYTFFGDDHINTSAQEQLIERLNLFSETRSVSYDLSEVQEVVSKKYSWESHVDKFLSILKS